MRVTPVKIVLGCVALFGLGCSSLLAAERVALVNGFTVECVRHESADGRTRLVLTEPTGVAEAAYMDVATTAIASIAVTADPVIVTAAPKIAKLAAKGSLVGQTGAAAAVATRAMSAEAMHPLLAQAGVAHRIDEDLLASVVRAESGGQTHAVSRTGARGLMQLMPGTASAMGVADAFEPGENVNGGAAYLDRLLLRYHDDLALALAAYNAGPGAVDKYHGVPPYPETRAYVTRVIREFNRRKLAGMMASNRGLQ